MMCFCKEERIFEKNLHFRHFDDVTGQKTDKNEQNNQGPSQQRLTTQKLFFQGQTLQTPSLNVLSCSE